MLPFYGMFLNNKRCVICLPFYCITRTFLFQEKWSLLVTQQITFSCWEVLLSCMLVWNGKIISWKIARPFWEMKVTFLSKRLEQWLWLWLFWPHLTSLLHFCSQMNQNYIITICFRFAITLPFIFIFEFYTLGLNN